MLEKVVHILSSMIFPENVLPVCCLTWPSLALQGLAVNPVSLACYVFVMPITKCAIYTYISIRFITFS